MKIRTALIALALLLLAGTICRAESKTESDIRRSVVRILATQRYPNHLKPWMKDDTREISGSGVVLDGQRILTNAHLIVYAKQIYVEPYQSSDKFAATVERLAPDIDLALLKVEEAAFWKNRPAIRKASGLPEGKDAVSVYGYPVGGTSLAVTKGAVARISYGPLGSEYGLHIQIDGAINPGNSGGPALVNDQMIGVVIGASVQGQNIGYVIPNEEIDDFLKRPSGKSSSKPRILDELQPLLNDALRNKLKLDRSVRGLLVRAPASSEPSYPLQRGDVITRIGSYDIDNDGMIRVKENLRLGFLYAVPKLVVRERVPITLERQGRSQTIDLPVVRERRMLVRSLDGKYPSYFVYGPLVFSPVSTSLARILGNAGLEGSPLLSRWNHEAAFAGEELVAVTAMLPHKITKGYGDPSGQVVKEVNGKRIRSLRHLVETLGQLNDPFVEFEFHEKYVETLVFERKEVLAAMEDILTDNNIGHPCSADVRSAWKPVR